MQRYKLYYWLEQYNSILPATLPDEEWATAIRPIIDDFLKYNYGIRDMIFDMIPYLDSADDTTILSWIKEKISLLFSAKNESYKRIYAGLTEEYNPLWNVDGTETETHSGKDTQKNSGNDVITNSGTDTHTIDSSTERDITHGGTDTNTETNTGTDTTTETNNGTDTTTNSVATFDNPSAVLSSQDSTLHGKGTTTELEHGHGVTSSLEHGETVSDDTDTDTTDSFEHGHVITTANGKQIEDTYGHVITRRRTGNIGVTKSTELLRDHLELWNGLSFIDMIASDIVATICYRVY